MRILLRFFVATLTLVAALAPGGTAQHSDAGAAARDRSSRIYLPLVFHRSGRLNARAPAPARTPTRTPTPVSPTPTPVPPTPTPPPPTPVPPPLPTAVPPPPPTAAPRSVDVNAIEAEVFALLNQQRAMAGCPALVFSAELGRAARGHSQDMATNNFVSHTGSDGSGIAARAARAGYTFIGGWEIMAAGQTSAGEVVAGWMSSASHRGIVLDCNLQDGGAGYVLDSTDSLPYRHYWTANFGRR